MKHALESIVFWIVMFVLMASLVSAVSQASEEHHKHKTQTVYINKDDNNEWKYVVGTAIATCAFISIYRQEWCWEKTKPDPIPDPGPAPNDLTPVNPAKVKLYQ